MDKLAKQLREDAEQIECSISPQLDERIRASLHGLSPEPVEKPAPVQRPVSFWWASSLTGIAAAVAVIAILNVQGPGPEPDTIIPTETPFILPIVEWKAETAVLTSPLQQEIEDLQSDLKKAEEAVKEDIDRLF